MPDTETKDDESTDVSPDQIRIAHAQAVSKLFQDAENAAGNVQGLRGQKQMITMRNQALAGQIQAFEQQQAEAKVKAEEARQHAATLDKEVEGHTAKHEDLTAKLAELDEAIRKLQAVNAPVDQMTADRAKLAADVEEEKRSAEAKKQIADGHRSTAQANSQQVQTGGAPGTQDHLHEVLQALQQIDTQIEASQLQATQKQKQAEDMQAMSDEDWFKVPDNRKAMKSLLTDAQQAAMKKEDDAAAANAKKSADLLVPDAEMKTLDGLVTSAKVQYQVAGRLPPGTEGGMDANAALQKAQEIDQDYDAITALRTRLAGQAGGADEGDQETKDRFRTDSDELRQMVREFKTKYGGGPAFDLKKMMPPDTDRDDVKELSGKAWDQKLVALIGKERAGAAKGQLSKFVTRWDDMKSVAASIDKAPDKSAADAWQSKIYKFLEQLEPFKKDIPVYKEKVTALIQLKDAGAMSAKPQALELLTQIEALGNG